MILKYPNDYSLKASKNKNEAIKIGCEFLEYIIELEKEVKRLEAENQSKENDIFSRDIKINKLLSEMHSLESIVKDLKENRDTITLTEYNELKKENRSLEADLSHIKATAEYFKKKVEKNKPIHNARGAGRKKKDKPYVEEVKKLRAEGITIKALAEKYNTSIATINRILGNQK